MLWMFSIVLVCLKFSHGSGPSKESVKIWNKQTDLLMPENWRKGKAPCPGAKINFPKDMKTSAFIEFGDFTTFEMVLPDNGVLIFDDGSRLLADQGEETCGKEVAYEYVANPGSWHDPANWMTTSYLYFPPLLHAEQIPSTYDIAKFEGSNSWKVFVEDAIELQKLIVIGQEISTEKIYDTMQSVEGSYSFEDRRASYPFQMYDMYSDDGSNVGDGEDKGSTYPITVVGTKCFKFSGCVSHGMIDEQMDQTCQYVKCEDHKALNCENPFKPIGHCCAICGMRLTFKGDDSLSFNKLAGGLDKIMQQKKKDWFVSFMNYDEVSEKPHYQLVVVGPFMNGTGWDEAVAKSLVYSIKNLLKITQGVFAGTLMTQMSTARRTGLSGGTSFGLFLLFVLLVAVAITAFWLYKNNKRPDLAMFRQNLENMRRKNANLPSLTSRFRKGGNFEGEDDQVYLEVPDSPRYVTQRSTDSSNQRPSAAGRVSLPTSASGRKMSMRNMVKAFTQLGVDAEKNRPGFENPSYQNLLERENKNISSEAEMEPIPTRSRETNDEQLLNEPEEDNHYDVIDDEILDRRASSEDKKDEDKSTYFTNPMFQFKDD